MGERGRGIERKRKKEKNTKTNKPSFLVLFFQLELEFSFQLLGKAVVGAPGDSPPLGSLSSFQHNQGMWQAITIPVL